MTDVLVVGAGPTGVTLAIDLARRGVPVCIIDRAPAPFAGSRGKGLTARTLEAFDDFGIVGEILALGHRGLPHRVTVRGEVVSDADPSAGLSDSADRPYAVGPIIPQFHTEQVLRNCLADHGIHVEYGAEVVAVEQDGGGVTAHLADGTAIDSQYLVGCDGGGSAVRKALGVGFDGQGGFQAMLIGDVEVTGLTPDRWYQWTDPDRGFLALCPFRRTPVWQLQAVPFADFGEGGTLPEPSLDYFQRLADDLTGQPGIRLSNPTWMSTWRVNVRMAERFRVGNVFLAGDAAHVHPPTGGLGMNTGIQDSYNLGWKLAAVLGGGDPALLDTYEEERRPIAAWTLGFSTDGLDRVTGDFADGTPRGIAAHGADREQLGLDYRFGSLATDLARVSTVHAGDRAPDAPCRDPFGDPVRLFDVFRGPQVTVLGFGGAPVVSLAGRHVVIARVGTAPGPDVDLVDDYGCARAAYGVDGDAIVVVRPDGYIGMTAAADQIEEVRAYLARFDSPRPR
ncbi:FAD-dependent oxidoreductase [Speluncibacter jeojiensis]|uniref:FAD-dependent oxidoreductase n=1 Tax=Speluncibacter jeojiensis TaxID=2710754 RepID=A0A9X4M145_9ACTN|nr:FAD-dependent oxidoreductase [Corynebacteriales bacterium D3-21]